MDNYIEILCYLKQCIRSSEDSEGWKRTPRASYWLTMIGHAEAISMLTSSPLKLQMSNIHFLRKRPDTWFWKTKQQVEISKKQKGFQWLVLHLFFLTNGNDWKHNSLLANVDLQAWRPREPQQNLPCYHLITKPTP